MALGSIQSLTEMSTRNLPGGKGRPARKPDNLIAISKPIVWEPRRLTTLCTSTACYRDGLQLYLSLLLADPVIGSILNCLSCGQEIPVFCASFSILTSLPTSDTVSMFFYIVFTVYFRPLN
jgi:hypothetical protein